MRRELSISFLVMLFIVVFFFPGSGSTVSLTSSFLLEHNGKESLDLINWIDWSKHELYNLSLRLSMRFVGLTLASLYLHIWEVKGGALFHQNIPDHSHIVQEVPHFVGSLVGSTLLFLQKQNLHFFKNLLHWERHGVENIEHFETIEAKLCRRHHQVRYHS